MWDKELEAQKILSKEKAKYNHFIKHKDGRPPTKEVRIGYATEAAMQSDFYAWALNSYTDIFRYTLAHIPNEGSTAGKAGAIKGAIRKSMGVVKSFPDFVCVLPSQKGYLGHLYSAIWIECKKKGGTLDEGQKTLHEYWQENLNTKIFIVSSFYEWRRIIDNIISQYYTPIILP